MKKLYLLTLCSSAFTSALLAANASINGGTQQSPSEFSNPTVWGGTLPTFDASTNVILNGTEGEDQYFTIDQDITVGSIKTQAGVNGSYYINAEGKTVTIDAIPGTNTSKGTDIITFSNGTTKTATGTFSIGEGTYNIVSTTATSEIDSTSRIGIVTDSMSGTLAKNITIESGAVINSHTQLALSGTVGGYGAINIAGEVNTFKDGQKGTGNLIIDWAANPYGTGGGTRTQVNVLNGGNVSTGNMCMRVQSKTDVQDGATLNISDTLSWELSSTNPGGILNSYGTTNIGKVEMKGNATAHSGKMYVNVKGGTTTIGTVTQSEYDLAYINVSAGTLNVTNAYTMDTGELNVSGGVASIANLAQTGGTVNVTGGTLNLSGTNTIASTTAFTSAAGSNIVFKSGSVNTIADASINYNNTKGNITFESGSTLNVNSLFKVTSGKWYFDGALVSTATGSGNWQSLEIDNAGTEFTFGENATFTATGGRTWMNGASLIINSATNSIKTNSFVLGTANLQFNKKNSVVGTNGNYNTSLNLMTNAKTTLDLNGTQRFGDVLFQGLIVNDSDLKKAQEDAIKNGKDPSTVTVSDNLATLTLDLAGMSEDDYVSFSYFKASYTHGDGKKQDFINLYVKDFENNKIFFTDKDHEDQVTINLYDADTKEKIEYDFVAGTVDGMSGHWLNAIPEPAEWAAIFGGIAFALAIYRRRK